MQRYAKTVTTLFFRQKRVKDIARGVCEHKRVIQHAKFGSPAE